MSDPERGDTKNPLESTGGAQQYWSLSALLLGGSEPSPAPEPFLRGIRSVGYYVWREGLPHGTTQ